MDIDGSVVARLLLHLGYDVAEDSLGIETIDDVDEGEIDRGMTEEGGTIGTAVAIVTDELAALVVATGLVPRSGIEAESRGGDIDEETTSGGFDVNESVTGEVDILAEGDGFGTFGVIDHNGFFVFVDTEEEVFVVVGDVFALNDEQRVATAYFEGIVIVVAVAQGGMEFSIAVDEEETELAVTGCKNGVACFHEGGQNEGFGVEWVDGEVVGGYVGEGKVLTFLAYGVVGGI